jgi:DNA polymerase-3 subunit gamma/tau
VALALYRKYRPRTFAEVIGQEHVTEPLSQALRSGRLHHAYLFSGPRGCGKTSSARILARSLNCEQGPTPEPCGVCASCKSLANDGVGSIDVIEIDAASHGGVDDARDLREKAVFAPASSRYKIYVIDEAHMVSPAGFNALLKLVEEPPDYVKFIFATTEPEKVLGTIKSRTHHYPFRLIPPAVLRPYLKQLTDAEGVRVEPAVFPLVVRAGGGSARDTLSVLDQLIAGAGPEGVTYARALSLLGVTDVTLIDEMCDALAAGDGAAAYATIDRVAEAGHDPRRFASDLLERFRDLIIMQQVPDAVEKGLIDGPTDQIDAMSAQAMRLGPATLSRCADIVHNGLVEMRGTTAPRLLLELITARMLLPGADDSAGALLQRLERMERRLTLSGEPTDRVRAQPAAVGDVSGAAADAGAVVAGRRAPAEPAPAGGRPAPRDGEWSVSGGGERPASGGGERPASGERSASGGGEQSAPGGGERPASSDAERPASGGGERLASGGGERPASGEIGSPAAAPALPSSRESEATSPSDERGVLPDAPEQPAAATAAPGQLSAAAIREVWPEIITTVGRQSKKVAALASGATVRELDGETVVLTFRFPAHAKMVASEPDLIANALYEALGGRWQIRCEVAGEAGGVQAPLDRSGPAAPRGASAQRAARPAANAARQREVVTPAATTSSDDDWPEPARPGGSVSADPAGGGPESGGAESGGAESGGAESGHVASGGAGHTGSMPGRRVGGGGSRTPGGASPLAGGAAAAGAPRAVVPSGGGVTRTSSGLGNGGSARAARNSEAARIGVSRPAAAEPEPGPDVAARPEGWSDGSPAEEPPYDPDYDGPPQAGAARYEGFDPGDEPLDDVIDEKTARQSSEQQAMRLLQDAFGAEKIGDS